MRSPCQLPLLGFEGMFKSLKHHSCDTRFATKALIWDGTWLIRPSDSWPPLHNAKGITWMVSPFAITRLLTMRVEQKKQHGPFGFCKRHKVTQSQKDHMSIASFLQHKPCVTLLAMMKQHDPFGFCGSCKSGFTIEHVPTLLCGEFHHINHRSKSPNSKWLEPHLWTKCTKSLKRVQHPNFQPPCDPLFQNSS